MSFISWNKTNDHFLSNFQIDQFFFFLKLENFPSSPSQFATGMNHTCIWDFPKEKYKTSRVSQSWQYQWEQEARPSDFMLVMQWRLEDPATAADTMSSWQSNMSATWWAHKDWLVASPEVVYSHTCAGHFCVWQTASNYVPYNPYLASFFFILWLQVS